MGFAAADASRSTASRIHALDALRATALLLGVLLHAALAYLPGGVTDWAVRDRSTHPAFAVFVLVVHAFRLEIFFLLAGFFGRMLHERLGSAGFIRNRMSRIVVPFAAGWLLVFPFLAFAWIWGPMQGNPDLVFTAMRVAVVATLGALASLVTKAGEFPLTHLWFLYYLALVYALFLAARLVAIREPKNAERWRTAADSAVRFLFQRAWGLPVLAAVTWAILLGMRRWGVDTPDKSLAPHLPALALYGAVFGLGWLLHRQIDVLRNIRARWPVHLGVALVATVAVLLLADFEHQRARTGITGLRAVHQLAYAFMMWGWMLASLGLFLRFRERESACWRYLADASYWVYVIHLPVVVVLQVALSRTSLDCVAKFGLTTAGAVLFSFATYQLFVRPTPVGQLLNGKRYPFFGWTRRTPTLG